MHDSHTQLEMKDIMADRANIHNSRGRVTMDMWITEERIPYFSGIASCPAGRTEKPQYLILRSS